MCFRLQSKDRLRKQSIKDRLRKHASNAFMFSQPPSTKINKNNLLIRLKQNKTKKKNGEIPALSYLCKSLA